MDQDLEGAPTVLHRDREGSPTGEKPKRTGLNRLDLKSEMC